MVYRNNLAAALLSERQNPEKALRLTLEIIQEYEEIHYASAINHALALALNRRYEEAMDWMNRIPQEEIRALKTPIIWRGWKLPLSVKTWRLRAAMLGKSREDVLMPGDKVWLERVLYELDQIGRKLRRIFCRQLNQKHFPLASRCDLLSSGHETFPWFSFFGSSSPSPSSGNIA